MANYSILILDSVDSLGERAAAWNGLWQRSDAVLPTLRAEIVSLWMERFAPNRPFRAIIVQQNDVAEEEKRFVAALPLYRGDKVPLLRTGMLPGNDWCYCGDLLLDPTEDVPTVLSALIGAFRHLPFDLLWLDPVRFESSRWNAFREQYAATGGTSQWRLRYQTSIVPLQGTRDALAATWKKSAVADIRRRWKKYYPPDSCRLEIVERPERIEALLPDCFELENAGWKGVDGGSILDNHLEDFYFRQARLLAREGLMRLVVLYYDDRPAAFQYNYYAKRTVGTMKISYDPCLRTMAPGQVLLWLYVDGLIDDDAIDQLDFIGIAGAYQRIWNPRLVDVGQGVLPVSRKGKLFFALYDTVMPWIRRRREDSDLRRQPESEATG